jgi:hypothetical protein
MTTTKTFADIANARTVAALTYHELCSMDFTARSHNLGDSWSPKQAFETRSRTEVGVGTEFETLFEYLTLDCYKGIAATVLLECPASRLPKAHETIRVFRAVDSTCGLQWGAILPGACVSESHSFVQRHAELYLNTESQILSTDVYTDELVTFGNPHEFIYIPRSVKSGFARYQRDVGATQRVGV